MKAMGVGSISFSHYLIQKNNNTFFIVKNQVTHYRFSISWSRVWPGGNTGAPNALGIQYYTNLINALKAANIQPMVSGILFKKMRLMLK